MTKKDIEKHTLQCLGLLSEVEIPIPVIEIANKLKVEVHEVVIPEEEYGAITSVLAKNGQQWTILLNETEAATRKRFAIAHALGHYVLHGKNERVDSFPVGEISVHNEVESMTEEQEATYFALCLLMPTLELKEAWQEVQNLVHLSKKFYVSHSSLAIRLQSLNLTEGIL